MKKWTPERLRLNVCHDVNEWYNPSVDEATERRDYYKPHPLPAPININYPFFGTCGDDLLVFILGLIEKHMSSYGDSKAEMAQEMALAILSGRYSREQMAQEAGDFIAIKFKQISIGLNYNLVSLDAALDEDGEVNLHDIMALQEDMTRLDSRENYAVSGTRYERTEFGGICGRY